MGFFERALSVVIYLLLAASLVLIIGAHFTVNAAPIGLYDVTTHATGSSITNTVITVDLPTYTLADDLIVILSRNTAGALTGSANITLTQIGNGGGRLDAYRVTATNTSEVNFTLTGANSVWSWVLVKVTGVDKAAVIASSTNAVGTNNTAPIPGATTTLGYTSAGTELAFYFAGVNATASWGTNADTIFNTTSGNAALQVRATTTAAGITSKAYPDIDRGLSGTNRLETSGSFLLRALAASQPVYGAGLVMFE